MGSVPGGLYEFRDEVLLLTSTWPRDRLQKFATAIEAAQRAQNRAAAEAAITANPEFAEIARRLLVPRDPGQFWAMIAVLLSVLTLAIGNQGETINVTQRTVIEQVAPAKPTTKPPPRPPPRKHSKKRHKH
jgi:hypothetical protein